MSNQKEIENAISNINQFFDYNTMQNVRLVFHKGNQTTGVTHKITRERNGKSCELFRAKKLSGLLALLVGFDYGIREFCEAAK